MTDIVQDAENFVKNKLIKSNKFGKETIELTTSQIRKFLSAVNRIENRIAIENEILSADIVNEIKYLKIMLAYQTGRSKQVRPLYDELIPRIDNIGESKKRFIEFVRYVEAIVAYHKFYGGN